MSILFTPKKIGNVVIKNRFVHSACEDNMATQNGEVTEEIISKNRKLAQGDVGLVIWSHLFIHPLGRTKKYQSGIHNDNMIPGLRQVVKAVHEENGKIAFQLGHAGIQTDKDLIGQKPMRPSTMEEDQIYEVIQAFVHAAVRAMKAGVDAIQLHAAHGYLINQFLSPYFNKREDKWGGSDENQFRLLKEIISNIKLILPKGFPLMVKLNTHDYTKQEGIMPELAIKYGKWLEEFPIEVLELSCGTSLGATYNMCRGDVPVDEMVNSFPESNRETMKKKFSAMKGKFDFKEPYNLEVAKMMKPFVGNMPLMTVGGWRNLDDMEEAVSKGQTDLIAMCRPFIREPNLIKRFKEGKTKTASCKNCNRCLAALPNNIPVRCYYNGFPIKK